MATAIADMSMSLDGFIADPCEGVEAVFGWYSNGEVAVPTADERYTFHCSAASAAHLRSPSSAPAIRRRWDIPSEKAPARFLVTSVG